ncbi:MAG: hypothetical protein A2Y74_03335, partial [Actinobacteria bacterium RBG_13_63_9]
EVSPYNFADIIRGGMNLPASVKVLDMTLREGRQVDGVSLRLEDVVEVARRLAEAGITLIEMHHDEPAEMREVKKLGLNVQLQAIVHPLAATTTQRAQEAVARCQDNGADIICFAFALSNHGFATYKLGGVDISPEEALDRGAEAVQTAKAAGAIVSVNLLDFTRVDLEWLKKQAVTLRDAGSDIIRIDDICAPCLPAVVKHHIWEVKKLMPDTPVAIHCHNDFGLATALELAGLEGGAEIVEGVVNGLGERSGVSNLAELVAAVELMYGYDTGIDLSALTELSRFVADVFNKPMPSLLPVVGESAFSHAIEGHHLFPDDPFFHQPFTAELVGGRDRVALCNYSGPFAIRHKCQELGLGDLKPEIASEVAKLVKRELRLRKHSLSDDVFRELVETVKRQAT